MMLWANWTVFALPCEVFSFISGNTGCYFNANKCSWAHQQSLTAYQIQLAAFSHILCGRLDHCNCFTLRWQRGNTCRTAEQVPDVFIVTLIHCALHVLHLLLLQAVCYSTHESLSSSVSASLLLKPALTPTPICPSCPCLPILKVSFLSQGGSHSKTIMI